MLPFRLPYGSHNGAGDCDDRADRLRPGCLIRSAHRGENAVKVPHRSS